MQSHKHPSTLPLRLPHTDLRPLLIIARIRVIDLLLIARIERFRDLPEFLRAEFEILMWLRLIPEDLVVEFIRFGVIIDDEALEILGALIHHLTEGLECRKHARVILVDALPVRYIGLSQNEDIVDVRS